MFAGNRGAEKRYKMGVGEIAGLIAAIAFAVLAGFMIYPLIRLGKLFDQIAQTVKDTGDHAIPALDESVTTVQQVNKSLEDVNKISAAASTTANNVGALTDLYGSFLGKPVIKVASATYALKSTVQSFLAKRDVNHAAGNKGEGCSSVFSGSPSAWASVSSLSQKRRHTLKPTHRTPPANSCLVPTRTM